MIQRILVPLDGSQLAENAVPHAVALAKSLDAEITLLRVVEGRPSAAGCVDSLEWRLSWTEASAYLEELAGRLDGLRVQTELAQGKPPEQIIQFAQKANIDLIALTTHGRGGLSEFELSGTAQKVIGAAGVSVLVVRVRDGVTVDREIRYRRILTPLDCSPRGDWALQVAAALARRHGAELCIAHVIPVPEMARRVSRTPKENKLSRDVIETNRRTASEYLAAEAIRISGPDLKVTTQIESGTQVAETLNELARRQDVDLIVLSAHGATGRPTRPYGSVATAMLIYGNNAILVLQDAPRLTSERRTSDSWARGLSESVVQR